MNKLLLSNIARFIILVLVQVILLSNINFLGYINPYLYMLFVLLLPFNLNQMAVLFLSFLIGITIDAFQDTGGIHAAACLVIAYIRPLILKFSFGVSYEHETIKFYRTPISQRIGYIFILVFCHHLVLFSLEVFNFSYFMLVLQKTLYSGIFTVLLILLVTAFFQKKK
ncbi:rod shape-determining protein MreD [Haloflavibacter putidus]|uniref:Rod shape-determining protein MreD n=1 Tax=Haloflavibacter putidus TaxID=2576776 RepID=A0A507ZPE5_9FLAO|nr:rod shape-determining protein MreD [Haloflavibacter putidus]TQD38877.1 rod shape-determining protein MreD [Haloflavibacter putidus]